MSAAPFTFDDDDFATSFPPPSSSVARGSEPPPPPSDSDADPDDPFSSFDRASSISSSNSKKRSDYISSTNTPASPTSFSTQAAMSPVMFDEEAEEKGLERITNAAELGTTKTFATSMTHNFEVVSKQVEAGIYAAKRVSSFLKKITIMEEEYAKNLQKQLAHEQTKMQRLTLDGMKQYSKAWLSIQDTINKKAKMMAVHASKVMSDVVTPLSEFKIAAEENKKAILLEERKWTGEMARARDEVVKGLSNCQKLIQSAKQTIDREKSSAAPQKSSASGLFQKFQQKLTKSSKSIQQDASKAAIAYNAAIVAANKRQVKYLETDLPQVFTRMQQVEKDRLNTIKAKLTRYVQLQQAHLQEHQQVVEDLKRAVDMMSPDTDIAGFIEDWVYEHGPPLPSHPYIYTLPCTPKEIEAGLLEGNPNSVFRSTLQHVMELQKSTDPGLDVPKILVTLIKAIKDLKGYETEGIFRISVAKSELEALHKQIDEGNYDIRVNTPHAPAALLKEWLRLLAEPLIPEELYEDAINSVKDREYSPSALVRIFDRLPKLNQRVVEHLATMAKEISNEKNSEVNKMSIDNLAIVFAPSFLRNPSDDPLKLLENSKYETKFTASLFRALPG